MHYENRIVLFLDILGFSNLVYSTVSDGENNTEKIEKLYNSLLSIDSFIKENNQGKKIVTQFSDSLVVSFLLDNITDKSNTHELLDEVRSLIIIFIENEILVRGAITYGKLIHTEKIIFGPALIKAYITESKAAIYPRVVFDEDLIINADLHSYCYENNPKDNRRIYKYIRIDTDEEYYLDYFDSALSKVKSPEPYLKTLSKIIAKGCQTQKPDLKIKYNWMKNKFNNMTQFYNNIYKMEDVNDKNILTLRDTFNSISFISKGSSDNPIK